MKRLWGKEEQQEEQGGFQGVGGTVPGVLEMSSASPPAPGGGGPRRSQRNHPSSLASASPEPRAPSPAPRSMSVSSSPFSPSTTTEGGAKPVKVAPSPSPSENQPATTTTSPSAPMATLQVQGLNLNPLVLTGNAPVFKRKRGRPSKASLELEMHFNSLQQQLQQQQAQSLQNKRRRSTDATDEDDSVIDVVGLDGEEDAPSVNPATIAPTILAQAIEYYRSIGITTSPTVVQTYRRKPTPISQPSVPDSPVETYRIGKNNAPVQGSSQQYLSPLTLSPTAPPCLGQYFPGLSYYDLDRKPLPPIKTDETIELSQRTLNQELTCPVCLGILRNTMTVMECLHRFCDECISKSLRLGRKECPTCRVKCSSRRSLRPDPNLDALIACVYPDLDSYEEEEDTYIEHINKTLPKPILQQSRKILRRSSKTTADSTPPTQSQVTTTPMDVTTSVATDSPNAPSSTKPVTTKTLSGSRQFPQKAIPSITKSTSVISSFTPSPSRQAFPESAVPKRPTSDSQTKSVHQRREGEGGKAKRRSDSNYYSQTSPPSSPENEITDLRKPSKNKSSGGPSHRVKFDGSSSKDRLSNHQGDNHSPAVSVEVDNSAVYYYPHLQLRSDKPLDIASFLPENADPNVVRFVLAPHPKAKVLRSLSTTCFQAPKTTTVAALLKFIAQSYNVGEAGIFRLYTNLVEETSLQSHLTLETIVAANPKGGNLRAADGGTLTFYYAPFTTAT